MLREACFPVERGSVWVGSREDEQDCEGGL